MHLDATLKYPWKLKFFTQLVNSAEFRKKTLCILGVGKIGSGNKSGRWSKREPARHRNDIANREGNIYD